MLYIARLLGVDWLDGGTAITPDHLEAPEKAEDLVVGDGDFLLVRTGWRRRLLAEGRDGWMTTELGLGIDCARWLRDHAVAAVGADNWAIEVMPSETGETLPMHCILIRNMGMPLAEILDLDAQQTTARTTADGASCSSLHRCTLAMRSDRRPH